MEFRANEHTLSGSIKDPGYAVGDIMLADSLLGFTVQYFSDTFRFRGMINGTDISGKWWTADSLRTGRWSANCIEEAWQAAHSPAVAPLYRYTAVDGSAYFYATASVPENSAYRRSEVPVCRVWKNPAALLILDYETRTVAVGE